MPSGLESPSSEDTVRTVPQGVSTVGSLVDWRGQVKYSPALTRTVGLSHPSTEDSVDTHSQKVSSLEQKSSNPPFGTLVHHPDHGFMLVLGSDKGEVSVCRCRLNKAGGFVSVDGKAAYSFPAHELHRVPWEERNHWSALGRKPEPQADPSKPCPTSTRALPAGEGARQSYKRGYGFPAPKRSRWTGHAGGPGAKRTISYREDWLPVNDTSGFSEAHDRAAGEVRQDLAGQEFSDPVPRETGRMEKEAEVTLSPTTGREQLPEVGEAFAENVEVVPGVTFTGRLNSLLNSSNTTPWTAAEKSQRTRNQSKRQREHTRLLKKALALYLANGNRDCVAEMMGLPRAQVRELFAEIANRIGEHVLNGRKGARVGCQKK